MVQQMIEVVYILPVLVSGFHFRACKIAVIKVRCKASEKLCHGKVCFGMAIVGGRINDPCPAIAPGHDIACPEVSVDQRRFLRFNQILVQMLQQGICQFPVPLIQPSFCSFELRTQPAVPEEGDPFICPGIFLSSGADEVVCPKAEPISFFSGFSGRHRSTVHGIELGTQALPVIAVLFSGGNKFLQEKGESIRIRADSEDFYRTDGTGVRDCMETGLLCFKGGQEIWRIGFHKKACAIVQSKAKGLIDIASEDRAFACHDPLLSADRSDGLQERFVFHRECP